MILDVVLTLDVEY